MQQSQAASIYTEYFYFTYEYYLRLDGKRFWMLNITRVIEFFIFHKIDPWQRLILREELVCSMITRSENATLKEIQ